MARGCIALGFQLLLFPAYGLHPSLGQAVKLGLSFGLLWLWHMTLFRCTEAQLHAGGKP